MRSTGGGSVSSKEAVGGGGHIVQQGCWKGDGPDPPQTLQLAEFPLPQGDAGRAIACTAGREDAASDKDKELINFSIRSSCSACSSDMQMGISALVAPHKTRELCSIKPLVLDIMDRLFLRLVVAWPSITLSYPSIWIPFNRYHQGRLCISSKAIWLAVLGQRSGDKVLSPSSYW